MRKTLFILLLLIMGVQPAAAHGYIVRAIPEDRAILDRAPTRLSYWFSEALELEFSELNVRDQQGEIIASGGVSENDNTLMTVRLPSDLPDGAYIVELRPAFASDGHVVAESRVFFVGEEVGEVAGQGASDRPVPLEVVWRVLVLGSTLLLFGASTLYAGVLVPAWGSKTYRAGLLPSRVMTRLNVIVGYALLAVFLGNGLALIQQTTVFFNISFTRALDQNFWSLVRIGSRFGDIWNWRMLFLGVVGLMYLASMYYRRTHPETVRPFWVANAWMLALVIGSFSVLSHAAGSLMWPWVGIGVDWLHALAVGFWVGGLAALVLVLPVALQPYQGDARRRALLAVLRRFSRVAAVAVFVVITTGIYSTSNWIYGPDEVQSSFGGALFIKIAMVAALVAVGALHHIALRPERYARFAALLRYSFITTLRLEAVLAVAVLIGAALLSATPVPVPDFALREVEAPSAARMVDELSLTLSLAPGGPGVNTYDVVVSRAGETVEEAQIRLRNVYPERDMRSDWQQAEAIEPGLYVTADDAIDRPGDWWTLVDVDDGSGERVRFAFDWQITNEASVIESVDPNIGNLLALAGVLVAVGVVMYPSARRFYALLDLNPVTVTVAVSATVITVIALVIGYNIVDGSRQRYDERLNPVPEVVNPVLPTMDSLKRGADLYAEHCLNWQAIPRDFTALRNQIPTLRDDELYFAVRDGWRDLPACGADLTEQQRWHVVNYFRTLAR
jgi:putative copper export protein/methionine-rich copper-binding protein CopC